MSEVAILLYHRIFDTTSDPQLMCVTPVHFAEHLDYLHRNYPIMSLGNLCKAVRKKRLPKRAAVITFDDGYTDNFFNAKPLLERHDTPATIFVTTDHIGKTREFWWDDLERLLLIPKNLPGTLELNIDGRDYRWESEEPYKIYNKLHALLYPLEGAMQQKVLNALFDWVGLPQESRPDYRALNRNEIRMLGASELIEIGSHGFTHLMLSAHSVDIQREEIFSSKRHLEELLGRPVNSFSYPYGTRGDIGGEAIRLAQEAGYRVACANFSASVTTTSNLFYLPRYLVRNWNKKEFALRLKRFFKER